MKCRLSAGPRAARRNRWAGSLGPDLALGGRTDQSEINLLRRAWACWGAPVVSARRTGQLLELPDGVDDVGGVLAGECQFFALEATDERENEGER